jgi:type II secretion system protein N
MGAVFGVIGDIFRFHKFKVFSIFLFAVLFGILIFPYSDLADLLTKKVLDLTQNQVYLQADTLGLSFKPGLGLHMDQVVVETPSLPPLTANRVSAAPSIASLLAFSPGFSVSAEGLFHGDLNLDFKQGAKMPSGQASQNINLTTQDMALAAISQVLREMGFDLKLQGALSSNTQISIDPTYQDQPKGTLDFSIQNFVLPSRVVNIALGPLQIPELKLQNVSAKGTLSEGRLSFEDISLGSDKDEFRGQIKGDLGITMHPGNGAPVAELRNYDFQIDLKMTSSFQKRAALFLMIADAYKTISPAGVHYAFRVRASNVNLPPNLSPYQ